MKTHKKPASFKKVFLMIFSIVISLILAGLCLLWFVLADYQSALPTQLCDEILNACKSYNTSTLFQYMHDVQGTDEQLKALLQTNIEAENLFYYDDSKSDAQPEYLFSDGKSKIARLTLQPTGETSTFGFATYTIKQLDFLSTTNITIVAPQEAIVFINGNPIAPETVTQTQAEPAFEGVVGIQASTTTYILENQLGSPSIEVIYQGRTCLLSQENGVYTALAPMQEDETQNLYTAAKQAAEQYAYFVSRRYASRYNVTRLLYPGTALSTAIASYNNDWVEVFDQYTFTNEIVENFTEYAPHAYSCTIQFDFEIVTSDTRESKVFPFHAKMYFTNINGTWQWVAMQQIV